jgi:hypothetical protein
MCFSVLGWIAGVKCEQSEYVNQMARFKTAPHAQDGLGLLNTPH